LPSAVAFHLQRRVDNMTQSFGCGFMNIEKILPTDFTYF
jgi:hypothetical protein